MRRMKWDVQLMILLWATIVTGSTMFTVGGGFLSYWWVCFGEGVLAAGIIGICAMAAYQWISAAMTMWRLYLIYRQWNRDIEAHFEKKAQHIDRHFTYLGQHYANDPQSRTDTTTES